MTTTAAFEFLLSDERERLIYGVFKRLHLTPLHPQYQDFLQESRIIFVEAYLAYQKRHPTMENEHDLMLFAYQRIRWRLLDMLRKEQQHRSNCQSMDIMLNDESDAPLGFDLADPATRDTEEETVNCELYERLLQECTENEAKYLRESFLFMRPITQIAKMHGVSRQSVYNWRTGVQRKAKIIFAADDSAASKSLSA